MKKQIVIIHGGETYATYDGYIEGLKSYTIENLDDLRRRSWKDTLNERLGENYDVVSPKMPNKLNAKYLEWKLWFEKLIPLLNEKVVLIGHSLGGIFLVKYLAENKYPKIIVATFLIAAPHDDTAGTYSLADFTIPKDLSQIQTQGGELYLIHSKDDRVVPFSDVEKYQKQLKDARAMLFEDRGHFNQEEFKELIAMLSFLQF